MCISFTDQTPRQLLDTKSTDRKQTLLHFIVHTISTKYPQVEGFLSECPSMFEASRVSMVTLSSDVQTLRKGIDLILYEREKQQNNFIIYSFYLNAVHKGDFFLVFFFFFFLYIYI